MGRPNIDSESTTPISHSDETLTTTTTSSISHFSHPHPLQLLNHQTLLALSHIVSCSCCHNNSAEDYYGCLTCNYFLHHKCSQLPNRITHPFDQHHEFILLTRPTYPGGLFICDACGKNGSGFCYHCRACSKDLHTECACLPMFISHHSHQQHQLSLAFSPPYPGNTFYCDLCKKSGSKYWLYHCSFCEFDVHLSCASMIPSSAPSPAPSLFPTGIMNNSNSRNPIAGFAQNFLHNQSPALPGASHPYSAGPVQPQPMMMNTMVQKRPNTIMDSLVQGVASGVGQALATEVIQEFVGGNNGGGDSGNDSAGGGGGDGSGGVDGGGAGGDGSYVN